ncbi:MAG: MFS transporter [bacterium]
MTRPGLRDALFHALNKRFFYGWAILGVAGLAFFASGPGQSHTFSVFVGPIGRDLGLSNAAIASAYGAAAGVISLALGFAALRFLGQGSLMLNSANLVAQWFSRRRGFALSLMALGFGASMAVHPPLGQWLVAEIGWRKAWLVLGVLTWLVMLPPLLLLVSDKPEDRGLQPDGDRASAETGTADAQVLPGIALREALRTPAFYIIAAGWCAIAMLVTTLHFYQVSILRAQGVSAEIAARVFPVSAVTMMLAMPFVGRAFDRFRTRRVFATGLLVTSAALIGVSFVQGLASAVAYAMLFGINNAFSMTMFGYLMPRYFGRRHLGSLQGTGQMIAVVGASLGPLPVGFAFDYLGGATLTLRLLALIPFACAVAAMFLRTPAGVPHERHLE